MHYHLQKLRLTPNELNSKGFLWPDAAVFLHVDLFREKEHDFTSGLKKHNVIWGEIATQMQEVDKRYKVTGLQCSTKFSGLKRTYKNIYDQNKKSVTPIVVGVMDSLIGEKAYVQPLAEASSEGPASPKLVEQSTSASSSPLLLSKNSSKAPKKRRVENILENFINDLKCEKENDKKQRDEEKKKREEERQARYQERKKEREQMHNDNIQIQKSLLDVMRTLANKGADCVSSSTFLASRTFISYEKIRAIGYEHSENVISLCSREQNVKYIADVN